MFLRNYVVNKFFIKKLLLMKSCLIVLLSLLCFFSGLQAANRRDRANRVIGCAGIIALVSGCIYMIADRANKTNTAFVASNVALGSIGAVFIGVSASDTGLKNVGVSVQAIPGLLGFSSIAASVSRVADFSGNEDIAVAAKKLSDDLAVGAGIVSAGAMVGVVTRMGADFGACATFAGATVFAAVVTEVI